MFLGQFDCLSLIDRSLALFFISCENPFSTLSLLMIHQPTKVFLFDSGHCLVERAQQLFEESVSRREIELSVFSDLEELVEFGAHNGVAAIVFPVSWKDGRSVDLAIRLRMELAQVVLLGLHESDPSVELEKGLRSVVDEFWDLESLSHNDLVGLIEGAIGRRRLLCELGEEATLEANEHSSASVRPSDDESLSLDRLGDIAGGLAHNLNNLMMGVVGNAELLKVEFDLPEQTLRRVEKLEESVHKASDLCQRMLSFSGQGNFAVQRLDLCSLIRASSELIALALPEHVSVEYNMEDALPMLSADLSELQQLLLNLVMNAGEALGQIESGVVKISSGLCSFDSDSLASVSHPLRAKEGDFVYLEIEDNGHGIAPGNFDRVFEPFFSTKQDGRGLGLSASQGIVKAHFGVLDMRSGAHGTTVRVCFPVTVAKKKELPLKKIEKIDRSAMNKVLVVDDEEVLRMVVSSLLKLFGYEPIVAECGADALERFAEHFDEWAFVMIDLNMPGMSGGELFKRFRAMHADLPVVIMSGDGDDPEGLDGGIFGDELCAYLKKPFGMDDLRSTISSLVEMPVVS